MVNLSFLADFIRFSPSRRSHGWLAGSSGSATRILRHEKESTHMVGIHTNMNPHGHDVGVVQANKHASRHLVFGVISQIIKIQLLADLNLKKTPQLVEVVGDSKEFAESNLQLYNFDMPRIIWTCL